MIILDIEKYCQECEHFRPDLETMAYCDGFDTVIRCEDRDKCRRMIEYLREVDT